MCEESLTLTDNFFVYQVEDVVYCVFKSVPRHRDAFRRRGSGGIEGAAFLRAEDTAYTEYPVHPVRHI